MGVWVLGTWEGEASLVSLLVSYRTSFPVFPCHSLISVFQRQRNTSSLRGTRYDYSPPSQPAARHGPRHDLGRDADRTRVVDPQDGQPAAAGDRPPARTAAL